MHIYTYIHSGPHFLYVYIQYVCTVHFVSLESGDVRNDLTPDYQSSWWTPPILNPQSSQNRNPVLILVLEGCVIGGRRRWFWIWFKFSGA